MLSEKLLNNYELGKIIDIEKDKIGTGNNYIVGTNKGKYFIKIFENNDTLNNPFLEVYTNGILKNNRIPVAEFVNNKKQKIITAFEDKVAHIQKFIPGGFLDNNELPDDILIQSGGLLGKIHNILKEYNSKEDFSFIKKVSDLKKGLITHKTLLEIVINSKLVRKQRVQDDLEYKIDLLERYSKVNLYDNFRNLSHNLSHGDYNCRQFIINNNNISAIIDFSRIAYLPVVWEITRSYTIGCKACFNGVIDLYLFDNYLKEYQKYFKLTNFEIEYMWEFYKIQLLGSSYGYKEYLYDNDETLLNFALWRTNLVRSLEGCQNLKRIV